MPEQKTLTLTQDKDGSYTFKDAEGNPVKDDKGNDLKLVKESDLLAVKGSSEAAKEELRTTLAAHATEVNTLTTTANESKQSLLRAEADVTSLKEQLEEGKGTATELAETKTKLATAESSVTQLTGDVLESRRTLIVATYGIRADDVKDKSLEELDNYEAALKAVILSRGVGNYALGGGVGGATPVSPIDRAKATIAAEMEKRGRTVSND